MVGGVDVFIESFESANDLGARLQSVARESGFELKMISNRGTQVYPPTGCMTECVDHWRCRFVAKEGDGDVSEDAIMRLLNRVRMDYRWMHIEKLRTFDGHKGFTFAQGEN